MANVGNVILRLSSVGGDPGCFLSTFYTATNTEYAGHVVMNHLFSEKKIFQILVVECLLKCQIPYYTIL